VSYSYLIDVLEIIDRFWRYLIGVLEIFERCPGEISLVDLRYLMGFYEIFDMCPEIFYMCPEGI